MPYNLKEFLAVPARKDGERVKIILTGYADHIMKYAKNFYDTSGNTIHDLKIIISKVSSMGIDKISNRNIYLTVFNVWNDWVIEKRKEFLLRDLFDSLIDIKESITFEEVINKMLVDIYLSQMVWEDRHIVFSDDYIKLI
jgi:hypothetical protein